MEPVLPPSKKTSGRKDCLELIKETEPIEYITNEF